MSKRKAVTITICICTSLFLLIDVMLFSYLHYKEQQTKLAQESTLVSREFFPSEIVWMGVANDGISTCVVENTSDHKMMILPGESVFLVCREGKKNGEYMTAYDTYLLKEYRIEDGLPRRTIDLTRILEVYPDYFIKFVMALWNVEGESYVEVRIDRKFREDEDMIERVEQGNYAKFIYVNLNSGTMFEGTSSQFQNIAMLDTSSFFNNNPNFLSDNISEGFIARLNDYNSITNVNSWVPTGCFGITLESIDLPQKKRRTIFPFPRITKKYWQNRLLHPSGHRQ